ncbi:hypothetical protein Patl1_23028 [Pistacia atlantica]|uniref:Uncharacterized protein n=1 Tax=Pistacia atlantica TaxID=434234 RepID=A0ACC0ZYN1_9ROSI|nr:hypothetical protein Patl1_23028 [Pistacia atlantica]
MIFIVKTKLPSNQTHPTHFHPLIARRHPLFFQRTPHLLGLFLVNWHTENSPFHHHGNPLHPSSKPMIRNSTRLLTRLCHGLTGQVIHN